MGDWLSDARESYDTVAAGYADLVRDAVDREPFLRGALVTFAGLVRSGPVADVGCGPGHVTAHLQRLGVDAFGIDLSPAMIDLARREHPGLRFETGSMTDLRLPDASLGGLLAWWALAHVPDEAIPAVLDGFHRVLRPGAPLMLGFHVGEGARLRTEGYGGPMRVWSHRRRPELMTAWAELAGFAVTAQTLLDLDGDLPGAILFARR